MCYYRFMRAKNKKKQQHKQTSTEEKRYEKRITAVKAIQEGENPKDVARILNVPLRTIYDWLARYRSGGWHALREGKRKGRPCLISGPILRWLYDAITMGDPRQYQFEFCLWTVKIIRDVLKMKFNFSLSRTSAWRLLRQLGLSPQRPVYRAVTKDPEAEKRFVEQEYPRIRKLAKRLGAEIFFLDEASFRSDHHQGTTWGKIGETPVVEEHRGRYGYNAISVVSPGGKMYFRTFEGRMNQDRFLDFVVKLHQDVGKPIIIVTDRASYHRGKKVKQWLQGKELEVVIEFIPPRCPELNPDEQVWNHAKNRIGKMVIQNKAQMKETLFRVLRSIQSSIKLVKAFFGLPGTRYAGQ